MEVRALARLVMTALDATGDGTLDARDTNEGKISSFSVDTGLSAGRLAELDLDDSGDVSEDELVTILNAAGNRKRGSIEGAMDECLVTLGQLGRWSSVSGQARADVERRFGKLGLGLFDGASRHAAAAHSSLYPVLADERETLAKRLAKVAKKIR